MGALVLPLQGATLALGASLVVGIAASCPGQTAIRTIYTLEWPGGKELLEAHNIGDIGSFVGGQASSERDGADEYILVDDHEQHDTLPNALSIRDGLTGGVLWLVQVPTAYVDHDGTWLGFDIAGGKNLVGDSYPDFAVGAGGAFGLLGRVLVYDGHTPTSSPVMQLAGEPPIGPTGSRVFGQSVEVIGDLNLSAIKIETVHDGYSELLVGDFYLNANWFQGQWGTVRVLDLNPAHWPPGTTDYTVTRYDRPIDDISTYGNMLYRQFAMHLAAVGDSFDTLSDPLDFHWDQDQYPEFAASDPYWQRFGFQDERNDGMWCMFTTNPANAGNPLVRLGLPSVPYQRMLFRGNDDPTANFSRLGTNLSQAGDPNNESVPAYKRYGALWSQFGSQSNTCNPVRISPGSYNDTIDEYGVAIPSGLHPNQGNTAAPWVRWFGQSAEGVGDINVDGYDDWAVVHGGPGPGSTHSIVFYSGQKTTPLVEVGRIDSWHGVVGKLRGIADTSGFNDDQRTSCVTRLGDLDLDGIHDVGIVTGADVDENDPSGDYTSEITAFFAVGSTRTNPVSLPAPGEPRIWGNVYCQVDKKTAGWFPATRIVVRVDNGPVGKQCDLYEGSALLPPVHWIPMCGGFLRLAGTPTAKVFNADGVATFIFQRDAATTPIGATRYFQAVVDPGGPCKLTTVHTMQFVDSSNPYQSLRE